MNDWKETPDGEGYWWYYGDDSNLGVVSKYRLRGVFHLRHEACSGATNELCADGMPTSRFKGVWCRCENPMLPGAAAPAEDSEP